jgi:hypothetical protein
MRRSILVLIGLVVLHLVWMPRSLPPVFPDFDAVGYFTAGKNVADCGRPALARESPLQFIGIHWIENAHGRYFSRYPPGVPAILATLFKLGGSGAALMLNPLLVAAAMVLIFTVVRTRSGDSLALLAAVLLAVNPLVNRQAFHVDAHTAATTCVLAIVVLIDRWMRTQTTSLAVAIGALCGTLPTLRYGDGAALLGVVAFFAIVIRQRPDAFRHALVAAGAAALPLAALAYYHHRVFGAALRTGYDFTGEQSAFGAARVLDRVVPYAYDLLCVTGIAFVLGTAAIVLLVSRRTDRAFGALLAGAVLGPLLVYMAYYWHETVGDSTPARFLLPIVPLLLAGAVIFTHDVSRTRPALRAVLVAALAIQAGVQLMQSRTALREARRISQDGLAVAAWGSAQLPRGSVVVAPFAIAETFSTVDGLHVVSSGLVSGKGCGQTPPPPSGELTRPLQPRRDEALHRRYGGKDCDTRRKLIIQDLQRWAGDRGVYLVGDDTWLAADSRAEVVGSLTAVGSSAVRVLRLALGGAR